MHEKRSDDWIPIAAIAAGAVFGIMAIGSVVGLRTYDASMDARNSQASVIESEAESGLVTVTFLSVEPDDRVVRLRGDDGISHVVVPGQTIHVSGDDFLGTFRAAGYEGDISVEFEVERPDGRESTLGVTGASPSMSLTSDGSRVFSGPAWLGGR